MKAVSKKSLPAILGALTALLALGSATTGALAAGGENYAFAVQAEAGLKLVITGYDTRGRMMFQEDVRKRESYKGRQHYVVRIDEGIVEGARLKTWCVEDRTGNWRILPAGGGRISCDTRPVDSHGTYRFVARTFPGAQASETRGYDAVAVRCVQQQLNRLGFDAGTADGIIGSRTFGAAESYIRYMKAGAGEPGWNQPDLTAANARHWCEKVADAHAEARRYWDAIN